jgi:ribosomal protein S18 acetylase RimI-like enzyme
MIPIASPDSERVDITIRPFVSGQDEATWIDITNRAWQEDEDFTPETVGELKRGAVAPWIGVQASFFAEVDGVPVAKVKAETDKTMAEKKGFITGPDVVPEHRRKGIGKALMHKALSSLSGAGIETAEVAGFDNPSASGFLESLGFGVVRRFCLMHRTLAVLPVGIGEAGDAEVDTLGRSDEDIALLCRIRNEAFKEHFNFAPDTLDNWKYIVKSWEERGRIGYITVARVAGALSDRGRRGQPAGYLLYGIDPKGNACRNRKRGGLWDIGVLKEFRGRGIAKWLMIDAMNRLRQEGMEEARLGVDESNVTNAMRLYERLGFVVARRRLVWHKNLAGFDAPGQSA